jgi:hypothetical protein
LAGFQLAPVENGLLKKPQVIALLKPVNREGDAAIFESLTSGKQVYKKSPDISGLFYFLSNYCWKIILVNLLSLSVIKRVM